MYKLMGLKIITIIKKSLSGALRVIVDFLVILRNKIEGKKMHDLVCIYNA